MDQRLVDWVCCAVRQSLGDICEAVVQALLRLDGAKLSLQRLKDEICNTGAWTDSRVSDNELRKALMSLIHHNVVIAKEQVKAQVSAHYALDKVQLLCLPLFPLYAAWARQRRPDFPFGSAVFEDLAQHGRATQRQLRDLLLARVRRLLRNNSVPQEIQHL
ncbi:MAG: hypothetical protein MHM6MM_007743, partial [Cercozoa sp. M6MM]